METTNARLASTTANCLRTGHADSTKCVQLPEVLRGELQATISGASAKGRRSKNQDHFLACEVGCTAVFHSSLACRDRRQLVLAVADGVGGQPAGEVASEIAVRTIHHRLAAGVPSDRSPVSVLLAAVAESNEEVCRQARPGGGGSSMATSLTVGLVVDRMLYVAHVGHSRAYLIRDGRARRLTRDHTLRQALLDGGIDPARVSGCPTLLTQALGSAPAVEPDLSEVLLRDGDRVLLCTDGVLAGVEEARLAAALESSDAGETPAQGLVAGAIRNHGRDNATAVCASLTYRLDDARRSAHAAWTN